MWPCQPSFLLFPGSVPFCYLMHLTAFRTYAPCSVRRKYDCSLRGSLSSLCYVRFSQLLLRLESQWSLLNTVHTKSPKRSQWISYIATVKMWFLYLGIAFTILCLVDLAVNTSHRRLVLSRLGILTGEATTSLTSTYSLSTKEHDTNARNVQTEQSYHELLPPHRRASLADLSSDSLKGPGKSAKELSGEPPDYSTLTPDKAICNTDDLLHHTTATGFTVEEIRRLGDFPDYATLSDIPLPNEYKGFNITTAMPRPYRPYRWPYHQTMCMRIAR